MTNNYFRLRGNLTKDVKVIEEANRKYIILSMAVDNEKGKTSFLDVFCFDKFAVAQMQNIKKGHPVEAEGRIIRHKNENGLWQITLAATFVKPYLWTPKDISENHFEQETEIDTEELPIKRMDDIGLEVDQEEYSQTETVHRPLMIDEDGNVVRFTDDN